MPVKLTDIREGSIVMVRGSFGSAPPVKVTVRAVDEDIKNGSPGIDYDSSWAYLHQIDRVVSY
jgi:hypothetical protein